MSRLAEAIEIIDEDSDDEQAAQSKPKPVKAVQQRTFIDLTSDNEDDEPPPAFEKKPADTPSAAPSLSARPSWPGAKSMVERRESVNGPTNPARFIATPKPDASQQTTSKTDLKASPIRDQGIAPPRQPLSGQPALVERLDAPPIIQSMLNNASSGRGPQRRRSQETDESQDRDVSRTLIVVHQPVLVSLPKLQAAESSASSTPIQSAAPSPRKVVIVPKSNSSGPSMEAPLDQESQGDESKKSFSSIGSTSPLIQRLKQKSASGRSTTSYEEMESILQMCQDDLKNEVALATRAFLEEAKETYRATRTNFVDKISPWKSIKALPHSTGPVPARTTTTKIETIISGKPDHHKAKQSRSIVVVATTIEGSQPRVPSYTAITLAKRNILTPDDEILKSMPYLGQTDADHKRLVKELQAQYTDVKLTNIEAERASQIGLYLDLWLVEPRPVNLGLTEQILQRYELQKGYATNNTAISRLILNSLGGDLSVNELKMVANFDRAFQSVFGLELSDVVLPESHLKALAKKLKPMPEPSPLGQVVFSTFSDFLCLICGLAYCQMHGDYNHNPVYHHDEYGSKLGDVEYEYDYQPLGNCYTDLVRKHELHTSNIEQDGEFRSSQTLIPCSKACYLSDDVDDVYEPWSRELGSTLKEFLRVFTNPDDQACNISFALNVPCWQVGREIRKYAKRPSRISKKHGVSDRPKWYNNEKKLLSSRWEDETDAHNHEMARQLNPCAHEGPCSTKNCPCFADNILCERMCGCSDNCGRRFSGCNCAPDIDGLCCTQDTCICLQMNRECGPECISCCALDRIDPQNKYNDELFTTGCQNIVMQRGVPKRLVIGESTLVGFGAYLAEPANRGDYLGEYIGEVISFTESERRAIIYERKDSSFLFDLNSEWTIDAAKQGNKTRFINHAGSEQTGQNCSAKVLFVNGEHRIKFLALRDIKVGEELLFNYGKKFGNEHFEKALGTTKGKVKKPVLTGDDLDALDGLKSEHRDSRKKIAALRGGGGSRRRGKGKARKTALKISDVLPNKSEDLVNVSFDRGTEVKDSDEDDDEEAENEGTERGRPKRRIRRPNRYTR